MAKEGPGRGMDITPCAAVLHDACVVFWGKANAGERLGLRWGHACPGAGTSPAPHTLGDLPGPPASHLHGQPQPPPLPPRAGTRGGLLPPHPLPILPSFAAPPRPSVTHPSPARQPASRPPNVPKGGTRGPAHVPRLRRSGPIPGERARLMSADCFHPNPISWQGFGSPGGLPPLLLPSRGEKI